MVRAKVLQAYQDAPATDQASNDSKPQPSKHQVYMQQLQSSGKSLAEVQTAWHEYYLGLTDEEKHEVWKEFYSSNQNSQYQQAYSQVATQVTASQSTNPANVAQTVESSLPVAPPKGRLLNIPGRLIGAKKSSAQQQPTDELKPHLQSLSFGLSMGGLVLLGLLFTFFNEYIALPFIQPSRNAGASPIIVTSNVAVQSTSPILQFQKINVQAPIDFALPNNDEATIQESLKNGIIHYKDTAFPGQNGNSAFFGHSSGNVFAAGSYKFIFSNLNKVVEGDTFYITYNGKIYVYRVFAKEIVAPTQVSILDDTKGKQATAILVTCNPPGFNVNRLVVWGEQISPSVATNTQMTPVNTVQQVKPPAISSNSKRLWTEILDKVTFWN